MLKCIKTGCYVRVVGHNSAFIGDAFQSGELIVFRLAGRLSQAHTATENPDYRVRKITGIFDKDAMSESQNATLICYADHVVNCKNAEG